MINQDWVNKKSRVSKENLSNPLSFRNDWWSWEIRWLRQSFKRESWCKEWIWELYLPNEEHSRRQIKAGRKDELRGEIKDSWIG